AMVVIGLPGLARHSSNQALTRGISSGRISEKVSPLLISAGLKPRTRSVPGLIYMTFQSASNITMASLLCSIRARKVASFSLDAAAGGRGILETTLRRSGHMIRKPDFEHPTARNS